ncbi:MFS transporter [Streptomyces sp. NPDC054775]
MAARLLQGVSGMSTALGPLLRGWLIDSASWRWVFLINVPLAAVALFATVRHVPESRARYTAPLDLARTTAITLGLASATIVLIAIPSRGWTVPMVFFPAAGGALLIAFVVIKSQHPAPLLPLSMFRSAQFTGANLVTFAVYGALSGGLFLLTLILQLTLGYSATAAGLATLPVTVEILTLSGWVGGLTQRIGLRLPMTLGPALTQPVSSCCPASRAGRPT